MSPSEADLHLAEPSDLADVMLGLTCLARDLSDPFRATPDIVRDALFGPARFAYAVLARQGTDMTGLALCNPSLSTVQGQAALFVSDLWVADTARGLSLGKQLLRAAMAEARDRWNAGSLRLLVHQENAAAMGFYKHLGFGIRNDEKTAVLVGPALTGFMGEKQ